MNKLWPGCPVALDAPGIPWASEGSCSGGKQIPTVALRVMGPGAVQLSSTRVVNRSRVGGAAGTLSHSLDTREVKGQTREEARGVMGSRREEAEKGQREKKNKKEEEAGTEERGW